MKRRVSWGVLAVWSACMESSASAAVVATLNGSSVTVTPSGSNYTVSIGTISNNDPDNLLRIYDSATSSGPPTMSVGSITIDGAIGLGFAPKLRVLVADVDDPWRENPATPISPGFINVGGVSFNNSELQQASILALAANGELTGDITVGRAMRIQVVNTSNTGRIYSDITATAADVGFDFGDFAINYIVTQDLLAGNILATGTDDDNDPLTLFGADCADQGVCH